MTEMCFYCRNNNICKFSMNEKLEELEEMIANKIEGPFTLGCSYQIDERKESAKSIRNATDWLRFHT